MVDGPTIVSGVEKTLTQKEVRHDLEREVLELRSDRERALTLLLGALWIAHPPQVLGQVG